MRKSIESVIIEGHTYSNIVHCAAAVARLTVAEFTYKIQRSRYLVVIWSANAGELPIVAVSVELCDFRIIPIKLLLYS